MGDAEACVGERRNGHGHTWPEGFFLPDGAINPHWQPGAGGPTNQDTDRDTDEPPF